MLAWVVMIRGHARQAAQKSPSLRTQRLCVKLSDPLPPAFPLVSGLPYLLPSSVSRNSLFATLTKTAGVCANNSHSGTSSPRASPRATHHTPFYSSAFFSHSCALSCTFLHPPKTQLFCFQAIPHSASKNATTGRAGEEGQIASGE